MTEELELDLMIKFKVLNIAEYTTKYGDYYGLMFAGAEIATKELNKKLSQAEADYDKMFWQKNETISNLQAQIEKMKCCGNCTKGNCVNIGQNGKACDYWTSNKLRR